MKHKVLFVGGGRRVSLAKRFISEQFEVFSYETDKNAPISTVATIIDGKSWADIDIKNHILEICKNEKIDLAIPLQDHATVVLSEIVKDAAKNGTQIPTASLEANQMCLDKKKFEEQLKEYDFYPKYTKDCKKVILKPRFGNSSKGIKVLSNDGIIDCGEDNILQKFIEGGEEISVDAYFNKNSKLIDAVPRRRLEVQGGEVSKSITLNRNAFDVVEITKKVGEKFGLVGPTCCQYIIDNNQAFIMEINARFGGGVILSLEAGFNMVDLLKKEYINNRNCSPIKYDWKTNFSMVRYFQEHFYE